MKNVRRIPRKRRHHIKSIYCFGPGERDLLIIAHTDLDGLISAYMLATALRGKYRTIRLVMAQPYEFPRLMRLISTRRYLDESDSAIVDLAINHIYPEDMGNMIRFMTQNYGLKYVIDHHYGWDLDYILRYGDFSVIRNGEVLHEHEEGNKFVILGDTPSCSDLVITNFFNQPDQHLIDLNILARISDDLNIRLEYRDTNYYHTLMSLKNVDHNVLVDDLVARVPLGDDDTAEYERKVQDANRLLVNACELYPGVGYVPLIDDGQTSTTILCEAAYQKYRVLIISEFSPEYNKLKHTIATSISDLNLVTVFGMKYGCTKKVSILFDQMTVDDIVSTLKPHLSKTL